MKFLILTITAGHGHNQTAKAIHNTIVESGHDALILDAYEYINPVLKESVSKGYLISTSISPSVYGKFYRRAEKKDANSILISPHDITTAISARKIRSFIESYEPDFIICTHVYAALLASNLEKKGFDIITAGIITDFTIHPYWDETNLDYYILANDNLKFKAKAKGLPAEKLVTTGIPISKKFAHKEKKQFARYALGLDDKTTVLIMSGSMGFGDVFKTLKNICTLDNDFQVVSICGNNKNLKKKIDKSTFEKTVYNYGFVDNVDAFMDAADVVISKPGGLTTSECMAKELPMIIISPIPGQEERNRDFLVNYGIALAENHTVGSDEILYHLLNNPERIEQMKENIRKMKKPNATQDLINFLIEKA